MNIHQKFSSTNSSSTFIQNTKSYLNERDEFNLSLRKKKLNNLIFNRRKNLLNQINSISNNNKKYEIDYSKLELPKEIKEKKFNEENFSSNLITMLTSNNIDIIKYSIFLIRQTTIKKNFSIQKLFNSNIIDYLFEFLKNNILNDNNNNNDIIFEILWIFINFTYEIQEKSLFIYLSNKMNVYSKIFDKKIDEISYLLLWLFTHLLNHFEVKSNFYFSNILIDYILPITKEKKSKKIFILSIQCLVALCDFIVQIDNIIENDAIPEDFLSKYKITKDSIKDNNIFLINNITEIFCQFLELKDNIFENTNNNSKDSTTVNNNNINNSNNNNNNDIDSDSIEQNKLYVIKGLNQLSVCTCSIYNQNEDISSTNIDNLNTMFQIIFKYGILRKIVRNELPYNDIANVLQIIGGFLSNINDEYLDKIFLKELINFLYNIVKTLYNNNNTILRDTLWALSNVNLKDEELLSYFFNLGILKEIIDIIANKEHWIAREALFILNNYTICELENGNKNCFSRLYGNNNNLDNVFNAILIFIEKNNIKDYISYENCYEVLNNMFTFGNIVKVNDINIILNRFENVGGKDKLNNLLNKINENSAELFEKLIQFK